MYFYYFNFEICRNTFSGIIVGVLIGSFILNVRLEPNLGIRTYKKCKIDWIVKNERIPIPNTLNAKEQQRKKKSNEK